MPMRLRQKIQEMPRRRCIKLSKPVLEYDYRQPANLQPTTYLADKLTH